jgi:hypothetical protein
MLIGGGPVNGNVRWQEASTAMTEAELAQIETDLSLRLPVDYRNVMLHYPFPPLSWPDQAEMPDAMLHLVESNRDIRKEQYYGSHWKDQFFAFGFTSAGDAFVLDTALPSSPVFRLDRHEPEITKETETLAEWVNLRIEWYVNFDPEKAQQKYNSLTKSIEEAGFFASKVNPMGGWDRICPASKERPGGGYTGNSFWVTKLSAGWYLGTWGGFVYRIQNQDDIARCCVSWLQRAANGTRSDFDDIIKKEFGLAAVTGDDFDAAIKAI